jgi:hypothetical protein
MMNAGRIAPVTANIFIHWKAEKAAIGASAPIPKARVLGCLLSNTWAAKNSRKGGCREPNELLNLRQTNQYPDKLQCFSGE